MKQYNQYEMIIVNLDHTIGAAVTKKRPYLIISPDVMNEQMATVVVCSITSQESPFSTRVSFDFEGQGYWIVMDQMRTIDKRRITKSLGGLPKDKIKQVKEVMKETYVD
jgi:mRNA interferase MazF